MKYLIAILFVSASFLSAVQAQITEGHAVYKLEMTSDNPEMAMALAMMEGSKMEMMFKGKATRTIMDMGPMMQMTTIKHADKDELLMLTDGMMGKKAIVTSVEESKANAPKEEEFPIEVTEETKDILGYTCKKVVMTVPQGGEMVFWATEKIQADVSGQNYMSDKIPGFPLEFVVSQQGMKMTFTATSFEKKVAGDKKTLFSTEVPEGYEKMTLEEFSQMGGM